MYYFVCIEKYTPRCVYVYVCVLLSKLYGFVSSASLHVQCTVVLTMDNYGSELQRQEILRLEALAEQERADEEFARRLAEEDRLEAERLRQAQPQAQPQAQAQPNHHQQSLQQYSATPHPGPRPSQYLSAGQSAAVKFSHFSTGNQLGEVVLARSTGPNVMTFELASSPGRFFSVNADGLVEFAARCDDCSRFSTRVLPDGSITLQCLAHRQKHNIIGGLSWFVGLTSGFSLLL